MDTVTIFIFFLVVLGGVFFGLFVGFGLIDFHEKHQEKKLMHKRKRRKNYSRKKLPRKNEKNRRQTGLKPKKRKGIFWKTVYHRRIVIRSLSVNLTGRIQKKKFQETVAHRILNIRQLWKKYQNDKVFIKIHIKSDCLQG